MNQSFGTQLQVLRRALSEIISPALADASTHVIEQLHLSIALIDFMRSRLPLARQFHAAELGDFVALGRSIAEVMRVDDLSSAMAIEDLLDTADATLADPAAKSGDLVEICRKIRFAIARLSEASVGQTYEGKLDALIVEHSTKVHMQARIWCEPFGFEPTPDTLPTPDWLKESEQTATGSATD